MITAHRIVIMESLALTRVGSTLMHHTLCVLTAVSHAKDIQTPHLRACYACSFTHNATTFVPHRNSISMYHVHSCLAFHVSAVFLFCKSHHHYLAFFFGTMEFFTCRKKILRRRKGSFDSMKDITEFRFMNTLLRFT
jgi:hypothetical protein